MTAERATKPAVQELFGKLASDEVQHQAFLKSVAKNYDEQGTKAFNFDDEDARRPRGDVADLHGQVPRAGGRRAVRDGRAVDRDDAREQRHQVLLDGGQAGVGPGSAGVLPVPRGLGAAALRRAAEHLQHRPLGPHGRERLLAVLTPQGHRTTESGDSTRGRDACPDPLSPTLPRTGTPSST